MGGFYGILPLATQPLKIFVQWEQRFTHTSFRYLLQFTVRGIPLGSVGKESTCTVEHEKLGLLPDEKLLWKRSSIHSISGESSRMKGPVRSSRYTVQGSQRVGHDCSDLAHTQFCSFDTEV